jgi:hypothetical protein
MSKKNNKYQKNRRIQGEIEGEPIKAQAKRKGHGDQHKANRRAKQQRQDFEFISAISETRHAA